MKEYIFFLPPVFHPSLAHDRQTAEPLEVFQDLVAPRGRVSDLDDEAIRNFFVPLRIDVRCERLPGRLHGFRLPHAVGSTFRRAPATAISRISFGRSTRSDGTTAGTLPDTWRGCRTYPGRAGNIARRPCFRSSSDRTRRRQPLPDGSRWPSSRDAATWRSTASARSDRRR